MSDWIMFTKPVTGEPILVKVDIVEAAVEIPLPESKSGRCTRLLMGKPYNNIGNCIDVAETVAELTTVLENIRR